MTRPTDQLPMNIPAWLAKDYRRIILQIPSFTLDEADHLCRTVRRLDSIADRIGHHVMTWVNEQDTAGNLRLHADQIKERMSTRPATFPDGRVITISSNDCACYNRQVHLIRTTKEPIIMEPEVERLTRLARWIGHQYMEHYNHHESDRVWKEQQERKE